MSYLFVIGSNKYSDKYKLGWYINNNNINLRFNFGIPLKEDYEYIGEKSHIFMLNCHVYENIMSMNKQKIINYYKKDLNLIENTNTYNDFVLRVDYFLNNHNQNNIKFIEKTPNKLLNQILKKYKCPFLIKKDYRCGIAGIITYLDCNYIMVFNFGLKKKDFDNNYSHNKKTNEKYHQPELESKILIYLHNINKIDLTPCFYEYNEIDCSIIEPRIKFILDIVERHNSIVLKNYNFIKYNTFILNLIDLIINNFYKYKINIDNDIIVIKLKD